MRYIFIAFGSAFAGFAGLIGFALLQPRPRCSRPDDGCVANLKQINGAKDTWALEHRMGTNEIPKDADLFGGEKELYIKEKPICPKGGTYILGRVGEKVRCTFPGHTL